MTYEGSVPLKDIMKMPDRGARFADNFLSHTFRAILADHGVDERMLDALIKLYLRNPERNVDVTDSNKIANDKGNLKKDLERNTLTIKAFFKLLSVLRIKKLKIGIFGEWKDGKKINNGDGLIYEIDPNSLGHSFFLTTLETNEEASFRKRLAEYIERTGSDEKDNESSEDEKYLQELADQLLSKVDDILANAA